LPKEGFRVLNGEVESDQGFGDKGFEDAGIGGGLLVGVYGYGDEEIPVVPLVFFFWVLLDDLVHHIEGDVVAHVEVYEDGEFVHLVGLECLGVYQDVLLGAQRGDGAHVCDFYGDFAIEDAEQWHILADDGEVEVGMQSHVLLTEGDVEVIGVHDPQLRWVEFKPFEFAVFVVLDDEFDGFVGFS
jgi:hypothetical protein